MQLLGWKGITGNLKIIGQHRCDRVEFWSIYSFKLEMMCSEGSSSSFTFSFQGKFKELTFRKAIMLFVNLANVLQSD